MPVTDKLLLRGLRLYGRHGVLEAENRLGQQFVVDVDVHCNTRSYARLDDIHKGLDYTVVFDIVKRVVQGPPVRLVECLADQIASNVLSDLPKAAAVRVKVFKPHVALPEVLDGVGVEILRARDEEIGVGMS